MQKLLTHIENYTLAVTIFLVPLTILPFFPNVFTTSKLLVLTLGIAITLLVKVVKIIMRGSLKLTISNFDVTVILLSIVFIAATFIKTPNRMEAILAPGTTTAFIASTILFFLVNQTRRAGKELIKFSLLASAATVSFISLLSTANALTAIPQLPEYIKQTTFSPIGSSIAQSIFLVSILPIAIGLIIHHKKNFSRILIGVVIGLMGFGLLISVFNAWPGKSTSPRLLDFNSSWIISVESLKLSPLFGVGPGNYVTAFNKYRPLEYNQTDLWAVRFATSRSFALTIITETGLAGTVAIGLFGMVAFKQFQRHAKHLKSSKFNYDEVPTIASHTSLFIMLVLLLLLPATPTIIMLLFVILALSSKTKSTNFGIEESKNSKATGKNIPAIVTMLPIVAFVLVYAFYAQKLLGAEYTFKKSLDAAAQNDGRATYNLLQKAINKNPSVDRYHASYAQVNLALANSIAQNPDITDEDRTNISQLVQQAIREGKSTVALNPERANNWEILASIYRAIIPLAKGADQYAAQSYNQATILDPINPNNRIALGGLFFAAGNYDSAIDIFRLAAQVKPDHANAHFNLAAAYQEKGDIDSAVQEMSVVLSLIDPTSDDFTLASDQLKELQTKRTYAREAQAGTNLTPPLSTEDPAIDPQLELPEDAEPPENPTPDPQELAPDDQPDF